MRTGLSYRPVPASRKHATAPSTSPTVHAGPNSDDVIAAVDNVITVMRGGGEAGVIGQDPQPRADGKLDRMVRVEFDHAVFLIGPADDRIAKRRLPVDIQHEAKSIIVWRQFRAAIFRQRE